MTIDDIKFSIKTHILNSISYRDLCTLCNIFSIPITTRRKFIQKSLIDSISLTNDISLLQHILYMFNLQPSNITNINLNIRLYCLSNELMDQCPINIRSELVSGVNPQNIFVPNFTKYPNGFFNAPITFSQINSVANSCQLPYIAKYTIVKQSPFYCCQVILHPLSLLIPKPPPNICQPSRIMSKIQLSFTLSTSVRQLLQSHCKEIDNGRKRAYKWQILLRFAVYDPQKPFPGSGDSVTFLPEHVPPYLSLSVNNVSVPLWDILPSNNVLKEGRRHARPINITDYVKYNLVSDKGFRQIININWWQTPGLYLYYYCGVFLERKLEVTELLSQFVGKTHSVQRPIQSTLDFIREKFNSNNNNNNPFDSKNQFNNDNNRYNNDNDRFINDNDRFDNDNNYNQSNRYNNDNNRFNCGNNYYQSNRFNNDNNQLNIYNNGNNQNNRYNDNIDINQNNRFNNDNNQYNNGDNNDDDDLIMSSVLPVSLLCPVGKSRICCPLRSVNCQHLQCFDAQLYLSMNERRSVWKCPVCDGEARMEQLFVDEYFLGILRHFEARSDEAEEVTEVNVNPDGTYVAVAVKESREGKQHIGNIISGVLLADGSKSNNTSAGGTETLQSSSVGGYGGGGGDSVKENLPVILLESDEEDNNNNNLNCGNNVIANGSINLNSLTNHTIPSSAVESVPNNSQPKPGGSGCTIDLTSDSDEDSRMINFKNSTQSSSSTVINIETSTVVHRNLPHPPQNLVNIPKLLPKLHVNLSEPVKYQVPVINGSYSIGQNPFQMFPTQTRLLLPANKPVVPNMMWVPNQNYPYIYPKDMINKCLSQPQIFQNQQLSVPTSIATTGIKPQKSSVVVERAKLVPSTIKSDNNYSSGQLWPVPKTASATSSKNNKKKKRSRIISTVSRGSRRSGRIQNLNKLKYNESSSSSNEGCGNSTDSDSDSEDEEDFSRFDRNHKNKHENPFNDADSEPLKMRRKKQRRFICANSTDSDSDSGDEEDFSRFYRNHKNKRENPFNDSDSSNSEPLKMKRKRIIVSRSPKEVSKVVANEIICSRDVIHDLKYPIICLTKLDENELKHYLKKDEEKDKKYRNQRVIKD